MIVKRLEDHIVGKCDMTSTQVSAAQTLLRKTLPDLSAVEHSGEVAHKDVKELSREELLGRIDALREASKAGPGDNQSDPVH